MNFKELLLIAINASLKAGESILKVYDSDFNVDYKQDESPLTLADKNSNSDILEKLKTTNIPILSEEGAQFPYHQRKHWEYFWLVDPLDGTKEFVKRNGEFTVNIALIHQEKPIMGIVYVPVKKDLYFALQDLGSFKKSFIVDQISSLDKLIPSSSHLPLEKESKIYTIVGSRSHMSKETEDFFNEKKEKYKDVKLLTIGSSLKLCMLAEGKADAYPRYAPTMEWDTGAGHAIVKIAGFSVHQYNTEKEVVYNKKNLLNPWFLAS